MELAQLQLKQTLSLDLKELLTEKRIREWYRHWRGEVYVSFSGGKDSTVLLHQVRRIYPDVPAVFADTGLEYPEIRAFVKTIDNVTWIRPKMTFPEVIKKYGYPVVSKEQSRFIADLQNASDNNKATCNLRLTGMNRKGIYCPSQRISKKWLHLIDAGFKISNKCCDALKKRPLQQYQRETGRKPFVGTMAGESRMRKRTYLRNGCNAFDTKSPISTPLAFWLDKDIWEYLRKYDLPYSEIYDMGETTTGCMFCMFGVHMEKGENRFQRMKRTHPKQYEYCINKLGCGKVLDAIGVKY